ncbi:MAG: hypothetical protein O3B01_24255 [Planctomycetota bacterium]|nr:hypothetical protein [Planctomycetota bacterium]
MKKRAGKGAGAPRTLFYRDLLCVLPFQLSETEFAIAAYIQTRNILDDHEDCGTYRFKIQGMPEAVDLSVWDPFKGTAHEFKNESNRLDEFALKTDLPDYPVWILMTKAKINPLNLWKP